MSNFPSTKANESYRTIGYAPTCYAQNVKDIPAIDTNNNNTTVGHDDKFSTRSQSHMGVLPNSRIPTTQKQFSTNNEVFTSPYAFGRDMTLPNAYPNSHHLTSMNTTLASPPSITTNVNKSFSASSFEKQESDEDDDDTGK